MKTMSNYNGHEVKDAKIPEGAMLMGRIDTVMYMHDGDIGVACRADDGNGESLNLVAALGMLEAGKKNIIDTHYDKATYVEDGDEPDWKDEQ
jgi:uncharacterized membrane-anchored protein